MAQSVIGHMYFPVNLDFEITLLTYVPTYVPILFPGEYAVRFIPRENGPHLVYVSFNGCQIPDSPFRIQVGTVNADPGMVQAYGDGLRTGKTGKILLQAWLCFSKVLGL